FKGVRGTGSLTSTWVLGGADATLAKGYDAFNILSQGVVPNYQHLSYQQMRNRVRQDVFKNALWGRPIGYFWHVNELRPDEVENFMDALVQGGATLKSNTQMVNLLLACPPNDIVPPGYVAGSYYVCSGSGAAADFRPTVNSPVRDAGVNLGAEYQYDLMGINQNSYGSGWEIGATLMCRRRLAARIEVGVFSGMGKKCSPGRSLTSAAKAGFGGKAVIAAVNLCATQNQVRHRARLAGLCLAGRTSASAPTWAVRELL